MVRGAEITNIQVALVKLVTLEKCEEAKLEEEERREKEKLGMILYIRDSVL